MYGSELQSSNDVLIMDNFESFNKDQNREVKISLAGYVECKSCPKLFDSVETRDRHYKKVHEAIVTKRQYECPICGKSFYNSLSFKRHKRLAHKVSSKDNSQFSCCDYTSEHAKRCFLRTACVFSVHLLLDQNAP